MLHRSLLPVALALAVLAQAGAAQAEEILYLGPHPVHPAAGGGFCRVDDAHVHEYVPVDPSAFARLRGLWIFVGDPTAFGFEGTVHAHGGPHEIPGVDGAFCTIEGRHFHLYAPAGVSYEETPMVMPYVTPFVVIPWVPPFARTARVAPVPPPAPPPPHVHVLTRMRVRGSSRSIRVAPQSGLPPAPPAARAVRDRRRPR